MRKVPSTMQPISSLRSIAGDLKLVLKKSSVLHTCMSSIIYFCNGTCEFVTIPSTQNCAKVPSASLSKFKHLPTLKLRQNSIKTNKGNIKWVKPMKPGVENYMWHLQIIYWITYICDAHLTLMIYCSKWNTTKSTTIDNSYATLATSRTQNISPKT